MSIVAIFCPKMGQHVSTGIEMDQSAFDSMPLSTDSLDCWACGGRHTWSRRWAKLVESDDSEIRRAGMPILTSAPLTVA
jgi:hypothetical protein